MSRNRFFKYCSTVTAFGVVVFFIGIEPAAAQATNDDQNNGVIEEVVKFGGALDYRLEGRQDEFGARTRVFELKRQISFADLDLSEDTDVTKLKSRIEHVAKETCAELASKRPVPLWEKADHQRCVAEAIERANDELETITAALRAPATKS